MLGINLLIGLSTWVSFSAGQFAVGQIAFMATGAYVASILTVKAHIGLTMALMLGGVFSAALGSLLALPAIRLGGLYLAVWTLGLVQAVQVLLENFDYVGGLAGFSGMTGTTIELVYAVVVLTLVFLWWMDRAPIGRAFRALGTDTLALRSLGLNVLHLKFWNFSLSALIAGLAGGLFAHYSFAIQPLQFGFDQLVTTLFIVVVGGRETLFGPIIGALVVTLLPEYARAFNSWRITAFGVGLVLLATLLPQGLITASLLRRVSGWIWPSSRPKIPQALIAGTQPLPAAQMVSNAPVPSMRPADLQLKNISVHFSGLKALDDVNVTVKSGTIVGVIGPNGAGKTTLFNVITGVLKPSSGEVKFGAKPITGWRPHLIAREGIVRTFQTPRLFRNMTVIDNVRIAASVQTGYGIRSLLHVGARYREPVARALEALELMDLGARRDVQASELSYGEQKMVEIARALVTRPSLLMMDEPAGGLNDAERVHLIKKIRELADRHLTIVIIEHDMAMLMNVAEHVMVLNFGTKICEGSAASVQRDPVVIEAYLGREEEDECPSVAD